MKQLALGDDALAVLKRIAAKHLDAKHDQLFIFGSRATGKQRQASDVDLLIRSSRPIALEKLAYLKEAFEESHLPFRVDVVDASRVSKGFLSQITPTLVQIEFARANTNTERTSSL